MGKKGRTLFDFVDHLVKLSQYNDPLQTLDKYIDFEAFRQMIDFAFEKVDYSKGGRPPYDKVMLFKILVIQTLYNLSDAQTEFQIADRLTFMRFLGLQLYDNIPDQNTIRGFRESLVKNDIFDNLFEIFNRRLDEVGLISKNGSMVDASFVVAPKQRNTRKENELIKNGEIPEDWDEKKKMHKDVDADWTKKNNQTFFGYKNHIKVDIDSKLITEFVTTSASVHDSEVIDELLDLENDSNKPFYGDSAYKSEELDLKFEANKIENKIHERGYRNKPLTDEQKQNNNTKSKIRARVEHVFGWMHRNCHELMVRTIGMERANAKITMMNLVYNMNRAIQIIQSGRKSVSIL